MEFGIFCSCFQLTDHSSIHVIARSDLSAVARRAKAKATKQSSFLVAAKESWIASRSLSSGAHSRDPLARNDGGG
jgi:hypothetical protein